MLRLDLDAAKAQVKKTQPGDKLQQVLENKGDSIIITYGRRSPLYVQYKQIMIAKWRKFVFAWSVLYRPMLTIWAT